MKRFGKPTEGFRDFKKGLGDVWSGMRRDERNEEAERYKEKGKEKKVQEIIKWHMDKRETDFVMLHELRSLLGYLFLVEKW